MIDTYLTALGKALHGPRRAKADLLAEARDHLTDAAEHHEHNGLSRAKAERAATEEFGPLDEIVPAYQTELGLTQGHRTALAALALSAAQPVVWAAFPSGTTRPPHGPDDLVENVGGFVILLALAAVLAYRFGLRHPAIRQRLARATGVAALGAASTLASASLLLTAWTGSHLALIWTVAFVLTPATWVAVSAKRCLQRAEHTIN